MINFKNTSFEAQESIEQTILKLAQSSYLEVADSYPEPFGSNPSEIFYQNACQQFSEILMGKLKELGIQSHYVKIDIRRIVPKGKHHIILSVGDYLIDGTWQQFLDKPVNNNQILIINKNSVEGDLQKANVPRELWFMYGVNEVSSKAA